MRNRYGKSRMCCFLNLKRDFLKKKVFKKDFCQKSKSVTLFSPVWKTPGFCHHGHLSASIHSCCKCLHQLLQCKPHCNCLNHHRMWLTTAFLSHKLCRCGCIQYTLLLICRISLYFTLFVLFCLFAHVCKGMQFNPIFMPHCFKVRYFCLKFSILNGIFLETKPNYFHHEEFETKTETTFKTPNY